jgi:hypothetical protein
MGAGAISDLSSISGSAVQRLVNYLLQAQRLPSCPGCLEGGIAKRSAHCNQRQVIRGAIAH